MSEQESSLRSIERRGVLFSLHSIPVELKLMIIKVKTKPNQATTTLLDEDELEALKAATVPGIGPGHGKHRTVLGYLSLPKLLGEIAEEPSGPR